MKTITLYRPVGQKELDLIAASGYVEFPPRLPDQPIFYPVLNRGYAEQIARDWNTKDERSGFVGYVLEFDVDHDYLTQFDIHIVGKAITGNTGFRQKTSRNSIGIFEAKSTSS